MTPEEALARRLAVKPEMSPAWTTVFRDAAGRIRARIRADAELFPGDEEVASLLEYLADHLLDSDLDVTRWLDAGGGSRAARERFTAKMGRLKAYLDAHRVAVAAEVLRRVPASRGMLGMLRRRVGIKDPRTFQRTFQRVFGTSPSEFQASAKRERASSGTAPAEPEEQEGGSTPDALDPEHGPRMLSTYWRRQVTLGFLDSRRAAKLRRLLRQWYALLRQAPWKRGFGRFGGYPFELLSGRDLELRDAAFRATDAIIERDAQEAPPELEKLFHAVHGLLFQPKLTRERILKVAGLHERSALARFEEVTGQTLWSYVREARLETAARLLLLTSLEVAAVGRLVGYTSRTTFYRSFRELAGLGPREYRRGARSLRERAGPPPRDSETAHYWEQVVSGRLPASDVLTLDLYLETLT